MKAELKEHYATITTAEPCTAAEIVGIGGSEGS